MKITSFQVRNYKGIVDTSIDLTGGKGSVCTLVGLNESGKTTILEAINLFRPDTEGMHAIAQKNLLDQNKATFIPKGKKSNFNDDVEITATLCLTDEEVENISTKIIEKHNIEIDRASFRKNFTICRYYEYKNSKYKETNSTWDFDVKIKAESDDDFVFAWENRSDHHTKYGKNYWSFFAEEITKEFPRIVYFPTFLFEFPDKILLSKDSKEQEKEDGEPVSENVEISESASDDDNAESLKSVFRTNEEKVINSYFREMVSEALRTIDSSLDLDIHIINRILEFKPREKFSDFLSHWRDSSDKENVDEIAAKVSRLLTTEIFGSWNDVVEDSKVKDKKVSIEIYPEENSVGGRHVYLSLNVTDRDSASRISELALGFRWFFSFILFTTYFTGNKNGESIFLFDEPASNLHSMAQNQLIKSLEKIAGDKNIIIFSTHSHYMINPLWLENTYIISNGDPNTKEGAVDVDYNDNYANIKAKKYKTFVGEYSDCPHYFRPILDKLKIQPISLEARKGGIIIEGKSDFYILNWFQKHHAKNLNLDFIPVGGAMNAKPLLSLYLGTAQNFVVLLDSDKQGNQAKKEYLAKLPVRHNQVFQIGDIIPGKREIEDVISKEMQDKIMKDRGVTKFNKKILIPFFAENLYQQTPVDIDGETKDNLETIVKALTGRLEEISNQ